MIKKINILNCGSYKNYYWQNNLCEFKNINILYGYNGSGKTTLSRIMRSFELKEIHYDYQDMKFELDLDGNKLNQNDIKNENPEGNYAVIEINFNPAIHIHCYPAVGKNRKIGDRILDVLGF